MGNITKFRRDTRPKLNAKQKVFICERLARYTPCSTIASELQAQGYNVSEQNINTNYLHGKKWQDTISEMRQQYLDSYLEIPISRRVERLKLLQKLHDNTVEENPAIALGALRTAAQETQNEPEVRTERIVAEVVYREPGE